MKFYFIFFLETIFDRKRIKNMIKKVDILGGRGSQGVWDPYEHNVIF